MTLCSPLHCTVMASIEPIRPLNELPMAQPRVVTAPRNLTLEVLRALAHPARMEVVAYIAARGYLDDLRESMHRPHVADHCDEPDAG